MAVKGKAGAGLIALAAAAVAIVAPSTEQFEGMASKVYRDPAGIPTYCYGETEGADPTRIYAKSYCAERLRARMVNDYAMAIFECSPRLFAAERKRMLGAAIDASYNAGPAAFCRSRMNQAFRAGQWRKGCEGFRGWYVTARVRGKPTVLPGLVKRRDFEAALCLQDVAR